MKYSACELLCQWSQLTQEEVEGREESQSFIIPQNCFTTSQKQAPLLKQFFWKLGCNCINISLRKTSVFQAVYSVSGFCTRPSEERSRQRKTDFTQLCNFDFYFLQNYKSKLGHWKYGNVVVLQILEAAGHEFCNGSEYDLQHPKTCSQTHKKRKKILRLTWDIFATPKNVHSNSASYERKKKRY